MHAKRRLWPRRRGTSESDAPQLRGYRHQAFAFTQRPAAAPRVVEAVSLATTARCVQIALSVFSTSSAESSALRSVVAFNAKSFSERMPQRLPSSALIMGLIMGNRRTCLLLHNLKRFVNVRVARTTVHLA